MRIKLKLLLLALIVFFLSGCANNPTLFERPAIPISQTISGEKGSVTPEIELVAWQIFFTDTTVRKLIALALEHNRDLYIATAKIAEAQGLYQIQARELIPSINAGASGSKTRNSENFTGNNQVSDSYNIELGLVSYELDFWGRIRNLKDAALSDYFATLAAKRTVKLSTISEVANAYYKWLTAKENVALGHQTLTARNKSLELIGLRRSIGIASSLDYAQAEVSKASVETQLAQNERTLSTSYAALEVLVGTSIRDIVNSNTDLRRQFFALSVPETLSSEVLLNRPDVIAAEEALYRANANIDAARAAFLPRVSLIGSGGLASTDLNNLFESSSKTWSFMPSISLPLFGNNLQANLDVTEARKIRTVAEYERKIQVAFSEVYTQFNARKALEKEAIAHDTLVSAQKKRLELSEARYNAGISSYLEVLDSQQDLFTAEQNQLLAEGAEIEAIILLYKALGGGDNINLTPRELYYNAH